MEPSSIMCAAFRSCLPICLCTAAIAPATHEIRGQLTAVEHPRMHTVLPSAHGLKVPSVTVCLPTCQVTMSVKRKVALSPLKDRPKAPHILRIFLANYCLAMCPGLPAAQSYVFLANYCLAMCPGLPVAQSYVSPHINPE